MMLESQNFSQNPQAAPVSLPGQIALVGGSAFNAMALFGIGLIMPGIKAAFAQSPQAALVPWVATLVGPAFVLSLPLAAYIIEKFGYRKIYLISIPLFAFAGAAPLFLTNLWVILPFRVLLGIATAGALTASLDGIGRLPTAQRVRLFGLQTFAGSLVAIITFPIIGYLAKSGWHLPFATYLLPLVVLPLAAALPRGVPPASAAAGPAGQPASSAFAGLSWVLVLFGGTVGLIMFTGSVFSPTGMAGIGVTNPAKASLILTAAVVMSMLFSAGYGSLHRRCGTNPTFLIALGLIAVGFACCGTASSPGIFTAGLLGYGGGVGLLAPNCFTWAVENSNASPGRTASLLNMAFFLTPLAFPFIAGLIGGHHDPSRMFLLFSAAAAFWIVWFGLKVAGRLPARTRPAAPLLK